MKIRNLILALLLACLLHHSTPQQVDDYLNIDPRMEKYFSKDFQEKIKMEKAKRSSESSTTDGGEADLELSDEELKTAKAPLIFPKWTCEKDAPSIEVIKEDEMTNNNYMKIMYRYKVFLLFVTATWCDYCCQHTHELKILQDLLKNKTYQGEEIPIVILQSNNSHDAIRDLKITFFKVPTLFLVKDKFFYQYNSYFAAHNILRFMNNIFNPVVELNTIQAVEDFFDTQKAVEEDNEFLNGTEIIIEPFFEYMYRNRLIGFFADKDEYTSEFDNFYRYAEQIAHRNELRVGIVTNRELIRHFRSIYEGSWFNVHSWNSVVLKRDDKTMFLDLSLLNEHLEIFMIYNTIPYVDELASNNTQLIAKVSTPIMLFFIDTSYILDNYYTQLKFMEYLSKEYIGKYVFMYMDGNTKTKTKEMFGLTKDMQTPNFVILYIKTNKIKKTPSTFAYCDVFVHKFLKKHSGDKYGVNELDSIRKKIKSFDDKIVANLKYTTKLEAQTFNAVLTSKKFDFIVFVVDTDYEDKSEVLSKFILKLSERLKALGIKTTHIATFDVNEQGVNHKFQDVNLNTGNIFFVGAKKNKVIPYKEKISILRLMKFIERNADLKIRLPEVPHLDLQHHDAYYQKKTLLESYDENFDKNEFEIDDIINMDFDDKKEDL